MRTLIFVLLLTLQACAQPKPEAMKLYQQGQSREALAAFRALTASAPQDAEAWFYQGRLMLGLDEPGALEVLKTARRLYAEDGDTRGSRAAELESQMLASLPALARVQAATSYLTEVDPRDPHALATLGVAHRNLLEWESAVEDFERARAVYTVWGNEIMVLAMTAEIALATGGALFEEGRFAEARAQLENCLAIAPDYALANSNLAACYGRLGNPAEAARYYRRAAALWSRKGDVEAAARATKRAEEKELLVPPATPPARIVDHPGPQAARGRSSKAAG